MDKKRQIISNRLNPNAGIAQWYTNELKSLVKSMTDECARVIEDIYKRGYTDISFDESISSQTRIALAALKRKYGDKFSKKAKILVDTLLKKTNKYAGWQFDNFLKSMLPGDKAKDFALQGSAISPEKSEIMKALLFNNVSLIKSISDEYFKQITDAVTRSIESGSGVKELSAELKDFGAKTSRRADLMAQDQTRKAYNSINLRNFEEAGIKKFKWLHSGGGREPRKYHKTVLDGKIFDINDPPVIDEKTGERGYPAQLPNCRCVMCAVLDFSSSVSKTTDEWKENKHPRDKEGRFTNEGRSGKINKKELKLPKDEYAKVMHELNTNLSKEQRKQKTITKAIGNYKYMVINKGFNSYIIIGKQDIDKMYD